MARSKCLLFACGLALTASTAAIAGLPADCSKAAIPAQAARGEIAGVAFAPTRVTLANIEQLEVNGTKLDDWEVTLTGADAQGQEMSIDVTTAVARGKTVDGRSFSQIPAGSDPFHALDNQPMAADGTPEMQGWDVKYEAQDVDDTSGLSPGTLRLVYGKRAGNSLPAQIFFCAPQTRGSYVAGHFTVDLTAQP